MVITIYLIKIHLAFQESLFESSITINIREK